MEKIKIICVAGPTAGGKTDLGVRLARAFGGEIVSADSMQLYKGAHIASAAADKAEMCGIKHHLLEFLPYDKPFTVYDYLQAARKAILDIHLRGKLPIIVGGTGLYINALIDGIHLEENTSSVSVRKALEKEYEEKGGEYMLSMLFGIDPKTAQKLNARDKKRIVRALEIYKTTGKTKSELDLASKAREKDYDYTLLGITYKDREKLYDRINRRVDIMLEKGLLDEAKAAFSAENSQTGGAVQAIGHKELFPYFKGETDLDNAVEDLKRQTRRYAKRQLTWFNKREDINWLYADCEDTFLKAVEILERRGYNFEKQ